MTRDLLVKAITLFEPRERVILRFRIIDNYHVLWWNNDESINSARGSTLQALQVILEDQNINNLFLFGWFMIEKKDLKSLREFCFVDPETLEKDYEKRRQKRVKVFS